MGKIKKYLLIICALLLFFIAGCEKNQEQEKEQEDLSEMENLFYVKDYITNGSGVNTEEIQKAIDECAESGGILVFSAGEYTSGKLSLRSGITVRFEDGSVLRGSDDYLDYGEGNWLDGFITGYNISNIKIEGGGLIDGMDCYNPRGEEGFRGPHLFYFENCENLNFSGYTVQNAANYAHLFFWCKNIDINNITVLAGHDGVHMQGCNNINILNCVFQTGDDCIAGSDNTDMLVENCEINTSCNGFRIGCLNMKISRCNFYGPGKYIHRVSNRTNMLAMITYFSPAERNIDLPGGDWIITDCTANNLDYLFIYNYEGNDPWQNGKPLYSVTFENITATELSFPLYCYGDKENGLDLTLKNISLSFRKDIRTIACLYIFKFNKLNISGLILENKERMPLISHDGSGEIILENIGCEDIDDCLRTEKVPRWRPGMIF